MMSEERQYFLFLQFEDSRNHADDWVLCKHIGGEPGLATEGTPPRRQAFIYPARRPAGRVPNAVPRRDERGFISAKSWSFPFWPNHSRFGATLSGFPASKNRQLFLLRHARVTRSLHRAAREFFKD